ncbi:uncharacterized protein LOC111246938 isoform X3 [Varroa destructor]|uniref:RanBP-type and C3HC4-type zinc finger-containing protein 1 n=1 Tax=Varroa destructor TaxID=109461 RepID=A0A7M7JJE4_VARDE|nr:uncharacterized protein LOC111246938 isoform X3 [Varroa destructor]
MDYRYKEDIPAGLLRDSIISYGPLGPLLTLGDRVVWVLRDGPQFGWVRWVGRLPDVTDDGWTIGVEFDNPVGSGDGRFAGKRYFFGRHDHALFLPNTNLMRADEYHLQVAKYDGFGLGNQKVLVPPYTTLPPRTNQLTNGADNEPQSEPCSANATPVQNKRSMFRAFKLKKSKSLQETVEASESGYENVGSGTHGSGEPQVDPSRELMRKEKFHFHLLPLRFPKSQSNSSVSSAPPNFGPPRIAGVEQDAENSSLSGEDGSLMSCLPSLGGSLLRRRKKDNGSGGARPKKAKQKLKKRANEQTPPFAFLTTSHESKLCGNGSGATGNMADSNNSNLVSNAPEDSLVVNASSSRQFAVLQQYRDSLEARSTPRLEKKLPYLANPQPGTSAEIQLHQFDSHSSTVMNSSQQVRHTSLNQLEQRRSLLTPIIPPEDDFEYLDMQDRRSNSLQITRDRSPIAFPGEPSSLPFHSAAEADSHVIKKKKKRRAPAPPPPEPGIRPSTGAGSGLQVGYRGSAGATGSLGARSSSSECSSAQRRIKKRAPSPPRCQRESTSLPTLTLDQVASAVAIIPPSSLGSLSDSGASAATAAPDSPRLNDLSRIDEDTESDFEYVLKRSDSKVNELVDAFHRLTEDSGDLSPEVKSDDGTLTPLIFRGGEKSAYGSGGLSDASFSSSTSTKWRYVDVSDSMSVDSNTSEVLLGAGRGIRRDSVSEYRLEFERRRAFYEPKNRAGSVGRNSAGGSTGSGPRSNRHSRSFEEPTLNGPTASTANASSGSYGVASGATMSFRDILKSQSNTSIASKGSTGSDKRPPIHPDSPTGGRQLLYKQLESAISKGEHDRAASLARQLALNKKKLPTITVNLYVEDKVSHIGPIRLNLNPAIKLCQLKQKIQADYRFPEDRQRWVIGKGLAVDNDRTLNELGVDKNDANLFLYLGSSSKYSGGRYPGTPKSLPKKFLESFPSSIRHILPENKARPATPPLQRAESVDSDEMWHTTADLQSSSLASSTARVRKRRQVIKLQTDQGVDKLNKLLKSQDTLKGWKCDLCGMLNRRAGLECVMCGSLNSVTGNEADDELFEGSLDDIVNLDRLSINKVTGDKISLDLSQTRDRLGAQQQGPEASCSKPPISPKSRSVSGSPPLSPTFAKSLQPASVPVSVSDNRSLSPMQRSPSAKSQIPRPIFVCENSPSPPKPIHSKTPPLAEAIWHINPSFEGNAVTNLTADLAVEEDFDISSESGSDTTSVNSLEVNEKMFELSDGDEVGHITDELGLNDPNAPSTSKDRPGSVIYRQNGEGQANGFVETRGERPTTAIFRPAEVSSAFKAEGAIKAMEMKHVVEEPARCISETTLAVQPQRAVLHMETGARPKQANIVKLKTTNPPAVPFKPLVTIQPWVSRCETKKREQGDREIFNVEVAATRNLFEEAKHTADIVERPLKAAEVKADLNEALETLRSLAESPKDYLKLMQLDEHDIVANSDRFECPVCLMPVEPAEGVVLRDCLHSFCKDCLVNAVSFSTDATVNCPFMNDDYSCESLLQEREIKALVSEDVYEKHLKRSMKQAETAAKNSFHCKTPDCPGWCFFEDNVNNFDCPVCTKRNCLTCQAIHHPLNCLQYQDHLELDAELTEDAKKTKAFLESGIVTWESQTGEKNRYNPNKHAQHTVNVNGRGDTSGGCRCGIKGIKCHPKCTYCH